MTGNVNIGVILVLFIGISLTYAVTLSVEEEQNAGAFVGTVDGVDNDYTLSDTHYFTLSEGRLYTNIKIDRESLPSDVIKLSAVSTSSSKQPVEIEVTVLDINDNDPTFPVPTVVLNLTESPSVNFKHILPFAQDSDSGRNSEIQTYELVSGDRDVFQLSLESSLLLKLLKPLNREVKDRYELRISATDSGTNPRSGHLNVVVHVLDTNDNPPVFNLDKINYVFSEDTAVGSKLFTVKAEDKDSGSNGLVTYSLASQSEPGTFAVNASTGDLTLEKPLDYEDKRQHRLEIVATDGGSPSMNDNAFVNVEVTNVNDNDPIISFSYIPDQATIASIGEHEAVGSVVALVTVKDPDVDRIVNDVKMEVVKGNELGFFEIEKLKIAPHLATIKVANNESLGLQRSYNLTIRADDPDPTSSRFTLANMIILVNFGQNHPPTFDQKTYTVTLPETAPIGSVVISVHATDNDIGLNGRLAYSITKGDVLDWFTIDRTTGLITTTKSLDFGQTTTNGSISLTITAKDETTNALSDDTTVEITIWDENNNAPVFSMLEYSFNKTENSVGPAGKIRATDRDYGLNGEVQYSITSAKCISEKSNTMKNFGAAFTVEEGGTVKVTRGLNREHCDRYILKVSASDMGKVPRKTIVDVIINVLDANDNSPVIYPIMYYERISPDTPVGTVLTKVIAYDVDLVDRDRITYRVSSASSYYDIDRNTGIVSLGKGVTRRDGEKHTVKFDAIDGDGNISSQKATLTVVINSTPDIKAHFSRKKYDFYLPENSNQNYSVGNVELESITGLARFEITNGNQDSAFGVDVQRGAIYVSNSSSLDAEKSSLRNLTIVAEINDASGDKTVGYLSVVCLVHVVDVNDNYPVFVSLSSNAFQVDSHVYADSVQILVNGNFERTTIYDAKAYDDDVSSRDRNLVYRIYSSSPEIEIDSSTGRVSYLPIEPSEMENLTVQAEILACDNELDSKCSKIQLNVTLKFIQNAIKDPLPNIHLNIPENALVGHQIATVPKLKDNFGIFDTARLDYSIEPEMPFRVYPRGEIVVSAELDHEKSVGHEMLLTTKIESNGKEWPKKSWMSLAVDDANDNFPTTAKKEHHFTIKESAKVGDIVGTVMVNDADSGVYGALTYEVQKEDERSVSGSDLFYCNKFTGDLFLTQTPDRKFLRLHNLNSGDITIKIVVSDQTGKNSSISTYKKTIIDVKITIDMENRNPLSFTSHTYYTEIRENLHTANILSVHATDADALWDTNMSAVHYSIYDAATKNASSRFSIGLLNGVIGLKDGVELDREEQDFYHLILKAEYADGSETAHSNVYIGVTDVKDSPPVFTQETYRFVISEDSLSLSSIGRVEARDGDVLTKRTHILYGFSSSDEERFGIDEISGFLFLLRPLNYSDQKQHIITVSAIDESDETSNATVIIDVTRTRDHIPRIKYQARSLIEGFYTSRQTLATPRYTESYTGQIQYSLLSPIPVTTSRSGGATFQVDHTTGYITAIGAIDRELTDKLKFVVRVSNDRTSKFEDISVTVNVKDRNDNLPAFTSRSSYVLTRASGLQAGHIIARITARDSDAGLNGAVTISLVNPPNPNFDLDRDGYLSIRSPLDTTKPVHNVELVATDRGSPPRSTRTSFHIILSDIAQSRTSDTSLSKVHLPETARKGSYVTTIQKTLARSVKTQFFLGAVTSSDGDKEINDKFTVDSTSGQIITNDGLIGFEGVYNIDVVTVEEPYQNGIAKISTRRVEVEISDENNNPPTFPKLTQRIAVSESARPGRIVATIKATDEDADSVITYSISSKTDDLGSDFVIDARSAVISVGRAGLDRERKSNYQLEVAADDGSHRSTTELLVDIEDVNDNPPRFNATPICFDLRENSPTGAFIGRLEAVDADLNSNVEYSIIDDESDSANFTVHAIYGTINFAGSSGLDREQQDLYVLRVKATDQDGLYSEGRVYIYITDENDHPPQLHITGSDTIEISEGTPIDSVIATIKGKDKDLGMNKEIYYSINSGDPEGKFRIGSYTGMIRISSSLDRENKGRYNLTIMGRNKYAGHGFEQVSYKSITVNLLDENDNDPQFSTDLVIYVDEDAAKGQVVTYVKAIDPDQDLDGKVRYYLMNQSPDNGIFRLNERSGQLVVIDNRDLDYEITKQYNLTLEARDRGHPHRKTLTHVLAQIVDANDHPPRFQKNTYTATLKENAAVGTRILRVVAEDSDAGFNSQIQYRLVPSSNASFLYIDRFTGEVSLFNVLDYEKQKEISVEIEASDGGVKALSDYSTLKLTVEDINDCSPVISPDHIILHVSENEINPSSLAEFTTVNQDPVKNCVADIRSSVRTLPNTDAFSLNVRSGGSSASLMLSKPLNRELIQQYELTITAGDPASPHKTGTTTVLVIVDDKNEFKPEFDQYEYFATISEDASPGTLTTRVKAVDADGPYIRYALHEDSKNMPFYIDQANGNVYLRGYLDREKVSQYNLSILAYDKKGIKSLEFSV